MIVVIHACDPVIINIEDTLDYEMICMAFYDYYAKPLKILTHLLDWFNILWESCG